MKSSITRRAWVAGSLGLTAGLAATRPGLFDRISPITDEIAESPEDALAFARQYGLRSVELRRVPGPRGSRRPVYNLLDRPELTKVAREFQKHGLEVSFLNTGLLKWMLPGTDPVRSRPLSPAELAREQEQSRQLFDRRLDDLRKSIQAAHILGTDKLRVFAFLRVAEPVTLFPRLAEILGEMGEIARGEGVRLLIENESVTNVATCQESADLLRRLPGAHFGLNWDPMNAVRYGEPPFPEGYGKLPRNRILNVQIKGKTLLFPEDRLDWAAIVKTMTADGYRGKFGLETHIWDPPGVVEYSHRSMRELARILEAS